MKIIANTCKKEYNIDKYAIKAGKEQKLMNFIEDIKEKKVEYIELIYDLIFVYVIGRNNKLLQHFENGFVRPEAFAIYIVFTLAVIQIWSFSMYYINIYGKKNIREHIFFFINMFLLYFVGEGARADWYTFHTQIHVAWALVLANIGIQYVIELAGHDETSLSRSRIKRMAVILFAEAAIVAAAIFEYKAFQTTWLSLAAIILGMAADVLFGQKDSHDFVDFPHLSERAMLYVVFTFGEMIIYVASYFEGNFSIRGTYFALMAFLIVVGLFLSYGVFYDRIIDREKKTNGLRYMFLHIFIIFALNNITNSLKFMQVEAIDLVPKMLFLLFSFLLYFGFLFALGNGHAKKICSGYGGLWLRVTLLSVVFAASMYLLRENMLLNIAVSVGYVFLIFAGIYSYGMRTSQVENMIQTTEETQEQKEV